MRRMIQRSAQYIRAALDYIVSARQLHLVNMP